MAGKSKSHISTHKRRNVPWAGWSKISPKGHQRTIMLRKCGKSCFLGPKKSFPICAKGTCKVSSKGLWAAYIRAKDWGNKPSSYKGMSRPTHRRSVYTRIAQKSKRMLKNYSQNVRSGKTHKKK
jgi:hypothetical protein